MRVRQITGIRGVEMNNLIAKGVVMLLMAFAFIGTLQAHGPACGGHHKNDPECVVAPPPDAIEVNIVSVDWLNETITVGGANFSDSTTITIAGSPVTINNPRSASQLKIPFFVLGTGNHRLVANDAPSSSTDSISFYLKGDMLDPTDTGCPCAGDWATELGLVSLWNPVPHVTDCLIVTPGGAGNPEDIAGTVLTDSTDPSVYPHYPIGAAFTSDPEKSVCQLTKVDDSTGIPTVSDLVKIRINRLQQGACRTVLVDNICSPAP